MFIDTHSHIYSEEFDNDVLEVIQRAKDKNVNKILLPNIDNESIGRVFTLTSQHKETLEAMMGLYPGSVTSEVEKQLSEIFPFVQRKDVIAIGEIGLDFYWDRDFYEQQIFAFNRQLQWSKDLDNKPLSIHCRKAFDEILLCLKKDGRKMFNGVFHCFGGDLRQAEKVIEMGFYLGIGGVLTFKNAHLAEVVKEIPLNNIVLETDAPYLTPVPFRGKRNEPSYLPIIAQKISEIKSCSLEEVEEYTSNNAKTIFNID